MCTSWGSFLKLLEMRNSALISQMLILENQLKFLIALPSLLLEAVTRALSARNTSEEGVGESPVTHDIPIPAWWPRSLRSVLKRPAIRPT